MKRKIFGLAVVVLAISLSAFEARPANKQFGSLFWFRLQPGTGFPQGSSTLIYQSYDPWACASWGFGNLCAGGYTSFYGTGPFNTSPYWPSGLEARIDYEIVP